MENQPATQTEAQTAAYVINALDRSQKAFEVTVNPDAIAAVRLNAGWAYAHYISVAVLHECFAHVMPDRARQAVEWLEGALEDDTAAQWVHEARAALARGERVPLPFDETERSGVVLMTETKQDRELRVEFLMRMNDELFEIGEATLHEGTWGLELPGALRVLADAVDEEIKSIEEVQ